MMLIRHHIIRVTSRSLIGIQSCNITSAVPAIPETLVDLSKLKPKVVLRRNIPKLEILRVNSGQDEKNGDMFAAGTQGLYDREFEEIKLEKYAELYKDDRTGNFKELLQTIISEYESLKYNTMGRVPSTISESDMKRLLEEGEQASDREKLFHYFFKREMARLSHKNSEARRKELVAIKKDILHKRSDERTGLLNEKGEIVYGLWHNNLFLRVSEKRVKTGMGHSRLQEAAIFGRKIIFDFGYEEYMKQWIYKNAIEQVADAIGLNKYHYREPFDVWFCNLKQNSFGESFIMDNCIKNIHDSSFITVKQDCFTNHFNRDRLIYLSPHARETLGYDICKSDDVYIIGVYNDKGQSLPLSLRKATKLGIRARKLPLDQHIAWQGPSKSLCVNHVTGILLEAMSNGCDWRSAFEKHLPSRKVKDTKTVIEEENIRRRRKRSLFNVKEDFEW